MANLISSASQQIREIVLSALGRLIAQGELSEEAIPAFNVEIPADKKNGDLSTNVAMVCARAFRKAPKIIADLIVSQVVLDGTYFEKCEVAGAGFINFFYGAQWYAEVISAVENEGEHFGETKLGEGKRVMVEFVSANPTGPMHIGNARGGAIGDCLASVLEKAGYEVAREFYINDAGNQIEKFATSLELRYLQLYKDGIEMPEDSYHGEDIITHAKNFAQINGDKFVEGDAPNQARRDALVAYALPINIQTLEDDLGKYRIHYDCWFRESTLHNSGEAREIVKKLTELGHTYEEEGAIWFKATEFGCPKDFVLVRANGLLTYVVPDIAYHYNKLVTRGFDTAINVLGADHHGYVPRLKGALQALGIDPSRIDVVLMQMVRLIRDGQPVKASKRSGKAITLATLLEEVPIDAARFFFNLREANSQFDFDLDLAISESAQNPVYYVQYAHARICSILKNISAEGVEIADYKTQMASLLTADEEKELIKFIATLPSVIDESAKAYDPAKITHYAVDVATLFHKFYSQCRVKCDDAEIMQARLALCKATKTVIKNILDMLKIDCPEQM